MDAEAGPTEDLEIRHAIGAAQVKFSHGCLAASFEPGLPADHRAAYLALHREALALAERPDAPLPMCRISHDDRGCTDSDVSIGSRELVFVSEDEELERTMRVAEGEKGPVFSDGSHEGVTGRALVRYIAFLRAELDRLPSRHPLHRRYSAQVRRLEARLGPVAHA